MWRSGVCILSSAKQGLSYFCMRACCPFLQASNVPLAFVAFLQASNVQLGTHRSKQTKEHSNITAADPIRVPACCTNLPGGNDALATKQWQEPRQNVLCLNSSCEVVSRMVHRCYFGALCQSDWRLFIPCSGP